MPCRSGTPNEPKGVIAIGRRAGGPTRWASRAGSIGRSRRPTRGELFLLVLAVASAAIALVAFLLDLIVNDPVSVAAMLVTVVLAVVLDLVWRVRDRRGPTSAPTNTIPPRTTEEGGDTSAAGYQGPTKDPCPHHVDRRPHLR